MLERCQRSHVYCDKYVICLSEEEMGNFGTQPKQWNCPGGVLFEANKNGVTTYSSRV